MTKHLLFNTRLLTLFLILFCGMQLAHAQEGYIHGVFTVNSNGDKVVFSQGNLQYQASTNTWRFAENQWDYVGSTNSNISPTYSDWIDLFGWGTSGYNHGANCYQPWSTSTTYSDYYAYGGSSNNLYARADWGYNPISNGGNAANQWRTLTVAEWQYVFDTRTTTSGIRYAKAKVNNVNGVILLPDNWSASTYSLSSTNSSGASFSSNSISVSQWTTLESAGAVFLPAAGVRNGTSVNGVGSYGDYWSASYYDYRRACRVGFDDSNLVTHGGSFRYNGLSVRLVRVPENCSFGINATPNPVEGGTVSGGGTYVWGATCTLTATPAAGYVFVNWTESGTVVSTEPVYCFQVLRDYDLVANFEEAVAFSDANVKAICVANWDTNGDGELGYSEAAAVTDLNNAFAFNEEIVSFDELQYFTGLNSLNEYEFYFCSGLTSISIPHTVTSLGNEVFSGCSSLASITSNPVVPPTTGNSVFDGVPNTATIHVPCGASAYQSADGWSYFTNYEVFGDESDFCPITFADANVKALCVAHWDANGDGELSYAEAAAVTDLGEVFKDNSSITSFDELQYFTGLTSIGNRAFYGCTGLTSVEIPNSVTTIGDYAFYNCSGLTSLEIPNSVTSIGASAFSGCSGLTQIVVDAGNTVYDSRNNCNAIIETATNTLISGCKNTVIPNSVSSIGGQAFSGCSGLTSLEIPNSVTSIGESAFSGCSGLTTITSYATTPPTLEGGVFDYVPTTAIVYVPCGTSDIYKATGGWNYFSNYEEIYMGDYCPIIFADANVEAICVAHWDTNGDGELSYAEAATVTDLGTYFKSNTDITSFDELEYFTGLASLPNTAFMSCTNLASISLPASLASLGTGAFFNCTSLSVMTVYAETPPTTVSNTFSNVPSSLVVKVPCGTSDAYQAATGWSGFEHIVEMCGSVTQTLVLSAGDNWCSFYVETSLADVQNALTEALGTIQNNQNLQIQSQTKNVKFTRGSWRGELSSLDFARTYIITVPSDCEITVEGVPVDPAEHPITLAPGANWIGYPVNATMTINEAFGSSLPVNNDIVQSQEKNSIRTRGQWRGELGTLQPGKGYMYQSASTGERTFTFPQ